MPTAVLLDAVRTPRGRGKPGAGGLSSVHPQELVAELLRALPGRSGFDARDVADVVLGCVSQVNEQGACIARNSVLAAEWPDDVTGVTLNRFCGSGLQAVNFGAMGIMSGQQDLVVAGGVESMSRVAMGSDGGQIDGHNLRLRGRLFQVPQGISADLIATLDGTTREECDQFAAESQAKAQVAIQEGRLSRSLIPVRGEDGQVLLDRDEHPRAGTTAAKLGALEPSFAQMGALPLGPAGETLDQLALRRYPEAGQIRHVHHAGNSSGIVDGAALAVLASEEYARSRGIRPRARIRATATAGSEPVLMLTAPTPASERALARAGMKAADIDLWEINEAFAVVPLNTIRRLGIDPARVNVNGGSIAYGHPLGATGAALLGTALDELERRGLATALVTLCIGGGMGIATILERL